MSATNAALKIVYGYSYYSSPAYGNVQALALAYVERLRAAGYDVTPFCLTPNPPRPAFTFADVDQRWRRGDRELLALYERLEQTLDGCDVLLNASGINLHPRFVERLPVLTVFQCFDDPENSANLSRPAAWAYDLCLVGNVAEVETYRDWGVRQAVWSPLGLMPDLYDNTLTAETIMSGERDIDLLMLIDKESPWRRARMDAMEAAFPGANFYGRGWSRGYLPNREKLAYLRRAKIGPNFHNSTGPINSRTFYLPANGVLQICDNKAHLPQVFELGREVVGFERASECIDLCRYYLAHDEERRQVALAGWQRVMRDYTETAIFGRHVALFAERLALAKPRRAWGGIALRQKRAADLTQVVRDLARGVRDPRHGLQALARRLRRYADRGRRFLARHDSAGTAP
jgi:spore maturation protein CgeB